MQIRTGQPTPELPDALTVEEPVASEIRPPGTPTADEVERFRAIAAELDTADWTLLNGSDWSATRSQRLLGWRELHINEYHGVNTATVTLRCAEQLTLVHDGRGLEVGPVAGLISTLWQPVDRYPSTQEALDSVLIKAWAVFADRAETTLGSPPALGTHYRRLLRKATWPRNGYLLVLTASRIGPWPFELGYTTGWIEAQWKRGN